VKRILSPNIDRNGRLLRALVAAALFAGCFFIVPLSRIGAISMGIGGLFMLFESLRGWCALRACGIKTRI
jgi:hypothetical protein